MASLHTRALVTYARHHVFVPRYRPEEEISLVTADGVRISGARLDGPSDAVATVVLLHGFGHSSRTPRIHAFAHELARRAEVLVIDLRGHGRSGGLCSLGRDEPMDVAAAVAAARPDLPVVTMGVSLGGAAALLHGGGTGGVDGVVAISSPGWWGAWDTPSTARIDRFVNSRLGRAVLAHGLHTRMVSECRGVPDSRDLVANIAPAFTLIVHDPEDHYFSLDHAETLHSWARPPKDIWLVPDAGHGTDLLTAPLARRLLVHIEAQLAGTAGRGYRGGEEER